MEYFLYALFITGLCLSLVVRRKQKSKTSSVPDNELATTTVFAHELINSKFVEHIHPEIPINESDSTVREIEISFKDAGMSAPVAEFEPTEPIGLIKLNVFAGDTCGFPLASMPSSIEQPLSRLPLKKEAYHEYLSIISGLLGTEELIRLKSWYGELDFKLAMDDLMFLGGTYKDEVYYFSYDAVETKERLLKYLVARSQDSRVYDCCS